MRDARAARLSRRRCCRRTSDRYVPALRALGFARQRTREVVARAARDGAAAARRMLVGRGDVGGERGDGQRFGRHRRRPRAFHAGESRRRISIARSKRRTTTRVLRAIFADARASSSTIRCRPRRSSATKARRTTRGSCDERWPRRRVLRLRPRGVRHRGAAPRRYPARQTREASRGDRAPARPRRRAHGVRAADLPTRSTPACSTTT